MPQVTLPPPILPVAWAGVLDKVQEALVRAEAEAAAREQAAAVLPLPAAADGPREAAWRACRERIEARLAGWQEGLRRAELEVQEVDAALGACQDALRGWLAAVGRTGPSVANGVTNSL